MTKEEAVKEFIASPYGLLATLTGLKTYAEIDAFTKPIIENLLSGEVNVSRCGTFSDVWNKVVPSKLRIKE